MTEETESLIVEILRSIQARLGRIELDLSDMKTRMSALETTSGAMKVEMGQQSIQTAALNARMDRFDECLSRIERRLDLIEV